MTTQFPAFRDFEYEQRQGGGTRTSAPLVPGVDHMVAAGLSGGLQRITLEGRVAFGANDADEVIEAAMNGSVVLLDNPLTATKVAALVGDRRAKWFALMATLPLSRVAVATKLLDMKLWHSQPDVVKLSGWMSTLDLSPENPWAVGDVLADGVVTAAQHKFLADIHKAEDSMADSMTYGTSANISAATMNRVYSVFSAANACASGFYALDPIRSLELCHTGEVCRIEVTSVGSVVRAWMSSPCKIKPGPLMMNEGSVELIDIGWSEEAKSLYGIFGKPPKKAGGFEVLRRAKPGDTFEVTTEPYTNSPPPQRTSPWAAGYTAKTVAARAGLAVASPGTSRTVPHDVLMLAGI